jgi:hypothetical protein
VALIKDYNQMMVRGSLNVKTPRSFRFLIALSLAMLAFGLWLMALDPFWNTW